MKIGIIGLGNMGRPIAEYLSERDEDLVIWNRTKSKAMGILNTTLVDQPDDVVRACDVILSVLANDSAINDVYHGAGGILSGNLVGKTIVELCTTSPETVMRLEALVQERGGQFLECPVSGNVIPARSGQLMGLAAGSFEAFGAAKPVLEKITRRLEYLGPTGAGAAMKLAVNLPLMVYWSALGEAIGLALAKDIDPALALDILVDSSGAIGAAKKRVPPILEMLTKGDPGQVSLSLTNGIKDMQLMYDFAKSSGCKHDVIGSALAQAKAAAADGWAEYDTALVGAHNQKKEVRK